MVFEEFQRCQEILAFKSKGMVTLIGKNPNYHYNMQGDGNPEKGISCIPAQLIMNIVPKITEHNKWDAETGKWNYQEVYYRDDGTVIYFGTFGSIQSIETTEKFETIINKYQQAMKELK